MRQGDHILVFWQTQKSGSIPEKFQREHLEHTSQLFARHAHVILTTLWLITYRNQPVPFLVPIWETGYTRQLLEFNDSVLIDGDAN